MRRYAAAALVSFLVACTPPPAAHKSLAQEPIGTGVVGGPSATLPTAAAAPSTPEPAASSSSPSEPAVPASSAPASPSTTVADLCPPKGQKLETSRLATKFNCKVPKPRAKQLADLRSNEQLLASMQPDAPEREDMMIRLAQGYAVLECSIASACTKARDAKATPDEISLAEAKKRTDDYCATLKSDFPKSKRHCP